MPFGQVNDSSETRFVQGTGLGLPLARAMAELHGGNLSMTSDLGKGTTVYVEIPGRRLINREDKETLSPLAEFGMKHSNKDNNSDVASKTE